jgi:predicted nucleic acid-binding protein
VYFTLQNISEFWNVATRPAPNNGLGFSIALVLGEIEKIERFLTLLPDSTAVYGEWKRLVVQHGVLGSKVHDAKLVATMNVHGVRRILTFNTGDFTRYDMRRFTLYRCYLKRRRTGPIANRPRIDNPPHSPTL